MNTCIVDKKSRGSSKYGKIIFWAMEQHCRNMKCYIVLGARIVHCHSGDNEVDFLCYDVIVLLDIM